MSSLLNPQSVSLLRWSALGVGIGYGFTRHFALTRFVKERAEKQEQTHYEDLVKEGKIAYEAQLNRKMAEEAAKDGIEAVDFDSIKFNAEKFLDWNISQLEKTGPAKAEAKH